MHNVLGVEQDVILDINNHGSSRGAKTESPRISGPSTDFLPPHALLTSNLLSSTGSPPFRCPGRSKSMALLARGQCLANFAARESYDAVEQRLAPIASPAASPAI